MIRYYIKEDVDSINVLGNHLHSNYNFKLDTFSKCLVFIYDTKIIGFISYSIIYDRAEIIDIIIDDKYRNNGYGKHLITNVIEDCINNKCTNITLEVNENNINAINFYKKMDFNIVATRKNYYGNDSAYLMEKKLEVK